MRAQLDLIGLYQWDEHILDDLVIPKDEETQKPIVDRGDLVTNLLVETAELEILYSDYDFLKMAIGSWSKKQAPIWLELWKTTQYEYNPIWNKDGTYKEKVTRDLAATSNRSEDFTRTDNLTHTSDTTRTDDLAGSVDTTIDSSTYGFNSSNPAPTDKSVEDTSTTQTGTVRNAGTDTATGTVRNAGSAQGDSTDTGTIETERLEQGNIGTTSTQSLILEQRNVVGFNIMDYIIEDFKKRFCLMVY